MREARYYIIADDNSIDPIEVFPSTGFDGIEVDGEQPVPVQSSECDVKGQRITGIIVMATGDITNLRAYAERLARRDRMLEMEGLILEKIQQTREIICAVQAGSDFYYDYHKKPIYGPMRLTAGRSNVKRCHTVALACRGPPFALSEIA